MPKAFRRRAIHVSHLALSWAAFAAEGRVWAAQHVGMPVGATSGVYAPRRLCLLWFSSHEQAPALLERNALAHLSSRKVAHEARGTRLSVGWRWARVVREHLGEPKVLVQRGGKQLPRARQERLQSTCVARHQAEASPNLALGKGLRRGLGGVLSVRRERQSGRR